MFLLKGLPSNLPARYHLQISTLIWETRSSYGIPSMFSKSDRHLRYFGAYMTFFKEKLSENGTASVLEEFVFSESANVNVTTNGNQQPAMLNRFMDGLIHPLIHTAYGLEFGLPGIVIEGMS